MYKNYLNFSMRKEKKRKNYLHDLYSNKRKHKILQIK